MKPLFVLLCLGLVACGGSTISGAPSSATPKPVVQRKSSDKVSAPARFVFTRDEAFSKSKFGIDLKVYPVRDATQNQVGMVTVETTHGHRQEFYDVASFFVYYIIEGQGAFIINGHKQPVKATDIIVVPPNHKFYYAGNLKMLLVTSPSWQPENEREVRKLTNEQIEQAFR
ncbi:MAG: AraC family ligand binding domain-containing protein [Myxococcales bacterium]|nr:MAG: AraC family ligand binding domain-containing protein [Myxococcales bacterium]